MSLVRMHKCWLTVLCLILPACQTTEIAAVNSAPRFPFVTEQSRDCIAVYGSTTVSEEQYNRVYTDIRHVLNHMNADIRKGMLNSKVKMLVVSNEDELEKDINFFITLLPLEAVYTDNDGVDDDDDA